MRLLPLMYPTENGAIATIPSPGGGRKWLGNSTGCTCWSCETISGSPALTKPSRTYSSWAQACVICVFLCLLVGLMVGVFVFFFFLWAGRGRGKLHHT